MPPRRFSRHTFTEGVEDGQSPARLYLTRRERFFYRKLDDNITHTVVGGETLQSIASRYFSPMKRPAGLWWVVADFQPEPIHDPTLALVEGQTLFVPSLRTLNEEILSEARRET